MYALRGARFYAGAFVFRQDVHKMRMLCRSARNGIYHTQRAGASTKVHITRKVGLAHLGDDHGRHGLGP